MEIIVKEVSSTGESGDFEPKYCHCYCSYGPYRLGNKSKVQQG